LTPLVRISYIVIMQLIVSRDTSQNRSLH